jgi:hypothetical protein
VDAVQGREVARAGCTISDDVARFGREEQLVGIVSRPSVPRPSAPAVVILNAGVLHRVGPHRLHVRLGRRLAAIGFTALRLDLGGIGDSLPSSAAATFQESAVTDTRAALSGLGAGRYVLFGVCAGADNALATALADERVVALVLVDPHVYATRRSRLRAVRDRIAAQGGPGSAIAAGAAGLGRRIRALLGRTPAGPHPPVADGRPAPPLAEFREQLGALVARGVGVLAIYSGALGAGYNHPDQVFEVFPELRGRIDRAYFPEANHTFTELAAQGELVEAVAAWVGARFP